MFGKDKDEQGNSNAPDDKQATDLETGAVRSPDNTSDTTVNNVASNDEVPSEQDAAEEDSDAGDVVDSNDPSLPQVQEDSAVYPGFTGGTRLDEVHARQEAEYRKRREAEINAYAAQAAEDGGVSQEGSSVPQEETNSIVVQPGETFESTGADVILVEGDDENATAVDVETAQEIPDVDTSKLDENNDSDNSGADN